MMSYHNKLHHLPFPELIILVGKGQIPKRLTTLKGHTPICVACIFGSAHKQSWRTKSKTKHPIRKESDNEPGARISMDQIVSAEPGLIPQMSGGLTNLWVTGAAVFVDHFSGHVFVCLMQNLTLTKTLLGKAPYERFLHSVGVTAQAYHANNDRFADKGFIDDCKLHDQIITFCGVGSHFWSLISKMADKKFHKIVLSQQHPALGTSTSTSILYGFVILQLSQRSCTQNDIISGSHDITLR